MDAKEWLTDKLEGTADWRRQKAEEYPDDARNAEAADLVAKLAEQVAAMPDAVFVELGALWASANDDEMHSLSELENEVTGELGFHRFPATGAEFVTELTAEVREALTAKA